MRIYPREKKWPEFRFRLGIVLIPISLLSLILSFSSEGWQPEITLADVLLIVPLLFKTLFRGFGRSECILFSGILTAGAVAMTALSVRRLLQIRREWYDNLPALRAQLQRAQEEGTLTAEQEKMLEELTETHMRH